MQKKSYIPFDKMYNMVKTLYTEYMENTCNSEDCIGFEYNVDAERKVVEITLKAWEQFIYFPLNDKNDYQHITSEISIMIEEGYD